jgi:gag-polyprotein putative aspartyl protease
MGQVLGRLRHSLGIIAMVASLAGCGTAAKWPDQTMATSGLASEECRPLQSVIEERERYGIAAPSHGLDVEALRQCGLPYSSGGGSFVQTTPYTTAAVPSFERGQLGSTTDEVAIEKRGGTYRVPVRINDTITLPFLLDTGAADLVIPADVALTLIRAGALKSSDFVGKDRYRLANGSEEVSNVVLLREVQVGEHAVREVTASISPVEGEPLLGQSFLSKFGAVTLDYDRRVLVLSR